MLNVAADRRFKKPEDRHSAVIQMRCTPTEKKIIARNAANANMTMSDYLITLALLFSGDKRGNDE